MAHAVKMDDVNFHYGTWHALKDITLSVEVGEVLGLLGHNGAGKTTTIRLLNGLLRPSSGTIEVLGVEPIAGGALLRQQTSVVNDALGLHERQTARQTMSFHAKLWSLDKATAATEAVELLSRFGLGAVIDTPVKSYSRGMRQRLALARSLLHHPKLLLLDEPTLGMDPVGRKEFRTILKTVTDLGAAVVMSTHDLGEVEKACDNVVILHHGAMATRGSQSMHDDSFVRDVAVTVDVHGSIPAGSLHKLEGQASVKAIEVDENTIHFVADDRAAIAEAIRTLTACGIDVIGVAADTPSLEDIYIAMHGSEQS